MLPDGVSALVGERTTGRVLRVRQGAAPTLVTTIPVDAIGGGGLTGLVLSPAYAEDQLVYAYITTPTDNRVVKLAPGEPPKPVFVGIPRGSRHNAGALGVDVDGLLLVATGDAGINTSLPGSLAGKVLRIDTLGRAGQGNPDPRSPVLSTGVSDPAALCVDDTTALAWVPDRTDDGDVAAPRHPRRRCPRPRGGGRTGPGWPDARRTTARHRRRDLRHGRLRAARATRTGCSAASRRPC